MGFISRWQVLVRQLAKNPPAVAKIPEGKTSTDVADVIL